MRLAVIAVFLVMLTTGLYGDTPVWTLELSLLSRALSEISEGLQMTALPLNEIELRLAGRESSLSETETRLSETEQTLLQRGLELSEREADLERREILYHDLSSTLEATKADLDVAREETRRQLWRARLRWCGGGLAAGAVIAIVGGALR